MSLKSRSRPLRASAIVYVAVFGTALLMRSWQFIGADSIAATRDYDDGVYLSSAMSLLHGSSPYADFVMVHPPGITLLLLPFAALAHVTADQAALVAAHLVWIVIGSLTATLVAVLARPWGLVPSLVGGLTYATWSVAVLPERSLNQTAVINLLVLLAVLALSRIDWRRSVVAAGVLLGLAMTIKIWAVVPFGLLGCWLLLEHGGRRASQLLLAGFASATAICLPFFVLAPSNMWHQVITSQLTRPSQDRGVLERSSVFFDGAPSYGSTRVALLVLAVCILLIVPSMVSLITRSSTNIAVDVIIAITAAEILVLTTSPSFFPHYAIWIAPGLALGAGRQLRKVRWRSVVGWGRPALAALALVILATITLDQRVGQRPIPNSLRATVQRSDCVWSSEATLLLQTNVLDRNLERGCLFPVDAFGTMLSQPGAARWQRTTLAQIADADVLVIGRADRRNLSEESFESIREGFTYVGGDREIQVYRRR